MIYPDGESVHGQSVSHSVGILPREHAKKREDLSSCSATICRFLRSRFTQAHTHIHAHRLAYVCRHTHAPCTTRNEAGIVAVAYSEHTTNTLRFITETQNLESKRIATVSNASSRDPWREAARLSKNTLALIATRSRSIESPNTHGSYDTTGRTVTGKSSPVYKCG